MSYIKTILIPLTLDQNKIFQNDAEASLTIYNANGKLILNLLKDFKVQETSRLADGTNQSGQKVTTGIYIYRLDVNGVSYNKDDFYKIIIILF